MVIYKSIRFTTLNETKIPKN